MKVIRAIWSLFNTKNFARSIARILTAVLCVFSVSVVCFGLLHPELNFAILLCTFATVLYTVADFDNDKDSDDDDD